MRPRRTARSLEDCLLADEGMARLSSHASRLVRLQVVLFSALPVSLARGTRVANLRSGTLFLHADNGAVAAKLRQMAPRLLGLIQYEAAEVTGLEIRVQGRAGNPTLPARKLASPIGDKSKRGLTSLQSSLPEGSKLRAALTRLIERS